MADVESQVGLIVQKTKYLITEIIYIQRWLDLVSEGTDKKDPCVI